MRKLFALCLSFIMVLSVTGCSSEGYEGKAKTPSGSSVQKGRDYQTVAEDFQQKGFINIRLEKLDDLITGWLTKEGEVESVSVDGDAGYSADKWYPADVEVVITYHSFPEKNSSESDSGQTDTPEPNASTMDEILTVDNCAELAAVFSTHADIDPLYSEFAKKYLGKTIEFNGSIDHKDNHISYNPFNGNSSTSEYEYDILVSYGDYDVNSQIGPTIKIESVSSKKLGYDVSKTLPDFMAIGSNVRIKVRVGDYNEDTGILTVHYEEITTR